MLIFAMPLVGMLATGTFSFHDLYRSTPFFLIGMVGMISRGCTPNRADGQLIIWYGISITPRIRLPLYRRRHSIASFEQIMIRGYSPSRSVGPGKAWTVMLIPRRGYDYRIGVSRHVRYKTAKETATLLAGDTGLPVEAL